MAKKIPEGPIDIGCIPDPALNHKHRVKLDIIFITQEQNIEIGRRLWLKFRNVRRFGLTSSPPAISGSDLYTTKAGLYISQAGKWGIIWLDDRYWRVVRKKKLKKRQSWMPGPSQPVMLKVDATPIEIEEARAKSLGRLIAKMEFEVEDEPSEE